jgi:serpin B
MRRFSLLLLATLLCLSGGIGVLAQNDATPQLVEGNTAFALDLYGSLSNDASGNLLVSPYSISQALAMTYAGASGDTAIQMADTLQFTLDQSTLPAAFQTLNGDLVARGTADATEYGDPARSLHIANGLWSEQTFPFSPEFSQELAEYYGAPLQPADFKNDPDGVRAAINAWVADHTEGKIDGIVPEGALTPDSRLVLANAIYFYGGWLHTFDERATADDDFHLADGSAVSVPFMHQQQELSYTDAGDFQMVELPYQGSGFTFTVILPDEGQFDAVESGLDTATLDTALAQLASHKVDVYVPKFEFDSSASLAQTLAAMGMTDAFDPNAADFSGMLGADAPEPLVISDVLHKAFISLDEEGTEAAAVTAVIMAAGAGAPSEEQPIEVRVDRPFIFLVRDSQSGAILFMGRVMDPSAA